MNKKDIAEIKRRLNLEHHNITCIRGCYVNDKGEVISSFTRSLEGMAQEAAEKYLAIFKRTLSGTQGQNLLDIEFTPEQVMDSEEHRLLTALKDTALRDEDAVDAFFQRVIASVQAEEHYLILLMHDGYDVPHRSGPDHRRYADRHRDGRGRPSVLDLQPAYRGVATPPGELALCIMAGVPLNEADGPVEAHRPVQIIENLLITNSLKCSQPAIFRQ